MRGSLEDLFTSLTVRQGSGDLAIWLLHGETSTPLLSGSSGPSTCSGVAADIQAMDCFAELLPLAVSLHVISHETSIANPSSRRGGQGGGHPGVRLLRGGAAWHGGFGAFGTAS